MDDDGSADFSKIQEAINAASPGDTIYVYNGTYYENILVNKTLTLIGENTETTMIDGGGTGTVVTISANNVTLTGFTLRNGWEGADISGSPYNIISHNSIYGNFVTNMTGSVDAGIEIRYSHSNTIHDNTITNNKGSAIAIITTAHWVDGMKDYNPHNNIVYDNIIANNRYGISAGGNNIIRDNTLENSCGISGGSNSIIIGNTINNGSGIFIGGSGSTIKDNTINNSGYSIVLTSSKYNLIHNNTINNGLGISISLGMHSSNNIISKNKITSSNYGIYLCYHSTNNIISGNNVTKSGLGIGLSDSYNNKIYHNNFINNTRQVSLYYGEAAPLNLWDDGYPSGGNHWSDYTGIDERSGPNQDQPRSDGIGDTPYVIDANNRDQYPLMNPWVPVPPIADFSYSPEFPLVGETITFDASASYDLYGTIVEYRWDFSDGNVATVTTPIIKHFYAVAGTYTINLTVTDNDGFTHSITKSVTIEKASSIITVNVTPSTVTVGSDVTINGTITPARVDINVTIFYRLSGGTWTTLATVKTDSNSHYTYLWATIEIGTYEIKASWQGDENTCPAESETKTATVTPPDSKPPTTTISLSGVPGSNGWFTSDVTVTLSASDDISEVDKTEYSFDNATWITFTTTFTITDEGTTTVYYKSTDKGGNPETAKFQTMKIDKTAPTGSIIINNSNAYTTSASVTLNLIANDLFSGVSEVRYSNDGVWDTEPWETFSLSKAWILQDGDGPKTVYYQIKDRAGLISTYSATIILDTVPPAGSITIAGGTTYTNSSTVILTLSAEDATSGVAQMCLAESNGTHTIWTAWEPYTTFKSWTFLTIGEGSKDIHVLYRDNAGLYSKPESDFIILDQTRPIADAGDDQTVNVGVAVTFDAGASNDNVGIVSYEWNFGDGTTGTGITATHTYTSPGNYTVTLTVKDAAGNTATHSITVTVLPAEAPPPPPTEAFPMWIIGAAAAIAAIGIAVTTILWKKRKQTSL